MLAPINPTHDSHTSNVSPKLRIYPLFEPLEMRLPFSNDASFSVILSKYESVYSLLNQIIISDFGSQTILRKKRGKYDDY